MEVSDRDRTGAHIALLSLFLAVVVRTAWLADDAEITFRSVMNLLNGYGPTFNIDERVQAYTHPLWFLLIAGSTLITRNVFASTYILSIALSLTTLWLLISRAATSFWTGMLAGTALVVSKAYVDFSASGLENPLSSFLLVVGLLFGFKTLHPHKEDVPPTSSLTVLLLIYLARPDLILIVLPFCLLVLWRRYRSPRDTARTLAIAIAPEVAWTIFSLFYYGAPLPNTAYAKLGLGIPLRETVQQGLFYLLDSLSRDPITLTVAILGVLLSWRQSASSRTIAAGIVLYLAYVVYIGGDFMAGRFLMTPLLAAAVIIGRSDLSDAEFAIVALVLAVTGLISLPATVLSGLTYSEPHQTQVGIADERGCFITRGIATAPEGFFTQPNWPRGQDVRAIAVQCGMLGAGGMAAGPGTHFIDPCALTDPLLARLPPKDDPKWRTGHFVRQLPSGYELSILKGRNLLSDPVTREYWEVIRSATRGPLTSIARLEAIARLNLGFVTKPAEEPYRRGTVAPMVVDLASLSHQPLLQNSWIDGTLPFEASLEVELPAPTAISSIDVSFDSNNSYLVEYRSGGVYSRLTEFGPTKNRTPIVRYRLKLDQPTAPADRIRISETNGDLQLSVGHLFLNNQ